VIETLQAELAETREMQAHLTAELEAMKKQMEDMYQIMQTIGQASGVKCSCQLQLRFDTSLL